MLPRASGEPLTNNDMLVFNTTRWLIVVTGCLFVVAGIALGMGLGFAYFALVSIIGVVVQPKFCRLGRGLICAGAILLSGFVFDIGFFVLTERHAGSAVTTGHVITLFSVLLVMVCDGAIVADEVRIRRGERVARLVLKST
jgi:hypothetical protein